MTDVRGERPSTVTVHVPGRAAMAGDHLDYLGGRFLALALDRRVSVQASWLTSGDEAVVTSHGRRGEARYRQWTGGEAGWRRYVAAVLAELEAIGVTVRPMRLSVRSTLPTGRGLGSSGAFSVAITAAVMALDGLAFDRRGVLDVCVRAERERVGAKVGLMDQYVPLYASVGTALLVDAPTGTHEDIPMPAAWTGFVVDSYERRSLLHTRFNDRGAECAEALRLIRVASPEARSLTDAGLRAADLERLPTRLRKRAQHVMSEHARVAAAADAIRRADSAALAGIMVESHASFSRHFEISTPVLDAAVAAVTGHARSAGVNAGAKVSGGGFGGALVGIADSAEWLADLPQVLSSRLGRRVSVWRTSAAAGIEIRQK